MTRVQAAPLIIKNPIKAVLEIAMLQVVQTEPGDEIVCTCVFLQVDNIGELKQKQKRKHANKMNFKFFNFRLYQAVFTSYDVDMNN